MTSTNSDHLAIPVPCACGRLRRASRALTRFYDDAMARSGLRITQFSLLRTLTREGTARMTDLAGAYLLDRTALARTLDPLTDAGYVAVARGSDARTRLVSITPAGRDALARAERLWHRAQAEVARHLGRERFDALIGVLADLETLHPDARSRAPKGTP